MACRIANRAARLFSGLHCSLPTRTACVMWGLGVLQPFCSHLFSVHYAVIVEITAIPTGHYTDGCAVRALFLRRGSRQSTPRYRNTARVFIIVNTLFAILYPPWYRKSAQEFLLRFFWAGYFSSEVSLYIEAVGGRGLLGDGQ